MKNKVGELYGKPIVIGNPNKFTKNEIALSELNEGFDDGMRYFLIQKHDSSFSNFMTFSGILHSISISPTHIIKEMEYSLYDVKAFATSSIITLDGFRTLYEQLNEDLGMEYMPDLSDTDYFKPITAKEYYSLLK